MQKKNRHRRKCLKAKSKLNNNQDDGLQGSERSLAGRIGGRKANKEAKDVYFLKQRIFLAMKSELIKTNKKIAAEVMPVGGKTKEAQ